MEYIFSHILQQIRGAEVRVEPFPDVVIAQIFLPEFYPDLIGRGDATPAIPSPEKFTAAEYRGSGFGKSSRLQRKTAGLAYPNLGELSYFGAIRDFLKGDEFCRALLGKFCRPGGIPTEKYRYFAMVSGTSGTPCSFGRTVLRGFIRSGTAARNFIQFKHAAAR
jgi:hypothetical protein